MYSKYKPEIVSMLECAFGINLNSLLCFKQEEMEHSYSKFSERLLHPGELERSFDKRVHDFLLLHSFQSQPSRH